MIKMIKGDLVELIKQNQFDFVIHGCNCFNTMGDGVALALAVNFPQVEIADKNTEYADENKLGTYSFATIDNNGHRTNVINAYTQYTTSRKMIDVFEYEAFENVLKDIVSIVDDKTIRFGLPLIGMGLAHGRPDKIFRIIEKYLGDCDTTIVIF